MKRKFRLTRTTDHKRVRQQGRSYAHPLVVLTILPSGLDYPRIAVTASRSVGGAVQRNRAKRLVREAARAALPNLIPGWDIVLICRKGLLDTPFSSVQAALVHLLHRAHLVQETHDH